VDGLLSLDQAVAVDQAEPASGRPGRAHGGTLDRGLCRLAADTGRKHHF
jgi:hypothetical protein